MEVEAQQKPKEKWMKWSVFYILINIGIERYSSTSTTNILVIYLHEELGFDMDIATALFHVCDVMTFVIPTFAAIIADGYAGVFKTQTWMMIVFASSCFIMSAGAVEQWGLPSIAFTLIGMSLFICGGSIRSSLAAFGADQYKLPEELPQCQNFFFIQMVFLKTGALCGRFFGPVLRNDVKCLGSDNCYPLGFGFPGIIVCIGIIIMLSARKCFVQKPPSGNMIGKVFGCTFHALGKKITSKEKKEHWLDYSVEKYGSKLVTDTKAIMRVMAVLVGICLFYSCFLQQNSRWIYQATKMNGDLGFYTLKPDQIIFFNPSSSLIMTPLCNYYLYPFLAKFGYGSLIHRMMIGGFVNVIGFSIAIFMEFYIQDNYICMLWLGPQYIISSLSEIMVLVSSLNFAYEYGPAGMKSVMTALVYLTVALGDSLIPIISASKIFESQAYEYLFFTILLFINMIVFCIYVPKLDFSKKEDLITEAESKEIQKNLRLRQSIAY